MFTHLSRSEGEERLHISHLHHYVSAYVTSKERVDDLVEALVWGLKQAKDTTTAVIVDQDGEMFFVVYPAGQISLCLRWKSYHIIPGDPLCTSI